MYKVFYYLQHSFKKCQKNCQNYHQQCEKRSMSTKEKENIKRDILSYLKKKRAQENNKNLTVKVFVFATITLIVSVICLQVREERCLIEGDWLLWEFSRPISSCHHCTESAPIILHNVSRESFKEFAYSSKPILIKGAINHWKARQAFNYDSLKDLYDRTSGSYESVEEGCQFLNFRTDLFSMRDVFAMSKSRAANSVGEKPWYIGWGNCHPRILDIIRKYYTFPEFLPEDAEFPNCENIFFGYENGAVMHLDYIPRLMWQGQVIGHKIWSLAPIPECEHQCQPFEFIVDPGDALLLDTRVWYHSTRIPNGEFSLTIQSEYG